MDILPTFVNKYIEALLFSTSGDNTDGLEGHEISPAAKREIAQDCQRFIFENIDSVKQAEAIYGIDQVAIDFCFTRNGHGAGFWDGDLPEALGEALTEAAKKFEQQDAYVGDDGQVHI